MTLEDEAQAVGTLSARQSVMMRPEVSGRVSRIGFADGHVVRRGQVLVQMDDTLQVAQLRQAEAQAAIARTNWQRQRDLVAQNFVSQSAVDQSAAALEVAEAQVALNRAQIARMRVLAPFDGIAGIAKVSRGDYLKDGVDMVTIDDVATMTVDFRLPERYVARVKVDQPISVVVDALPGQSFAGKVQALDSQLDSNGRSLLVRASVDNAQRSLRSGMFGRTRIVFATRPQAVVVPEEALVPQGAKQFVLKVVDAPAGAAAPGAPAVAAGSSNAAVTPAGGASERPAGPPKVSQRVEVKVGIRVAGKVEVLEGIAANDVVVTAGQARLMARDGAPVRVIDLDRVGTGGREGGAARPVASGPAASGPTATGTTSPAAASPAKAGSDASAKPRQ